MAEITAKDIAALRQLTGAGILDCRRALQETNGDIEAASRWLREQGLAGASKRADRERAEGAVSVIVTPAGVGAIVALECETDFVAKSTDFVNLVDEIAEALAEKGEEGIAGFQSRIDSMKVLLKENIDLGRHERFEAGEGSVLESYLHVQNGRGVNGVLVEIANGSHELAHDIALHIAFAKPRYLRREDVPSDEIERERETVTTISRNEGKPDAALPKIVEGRLNGWFKEIVLLEQNFARDDKQSITQLLGGAEVVRFAQVVVGA
jgi:elongation factor Ts